MAISGARWNKALQCCSCGGVLLVVSLVLICSRMNRYWLASMELMSVGLLLVVKSRVSWLFCMPKTCIVCWSAEGFSLGVVCHWMVCHCVAGPISGVLMYPLLAVVMGVMLSVAGAWGVSEMVACPLFGLFLIPKATKALEVSKLLRLLIPIWVKNCSNMSESGLLNRWFFTLYAST